MRGFIPTAAVAATPQYSGVLRMVGASGGKQLQCFKPTPISARSAFSGRAVVGGAGGREGFKMESKRDPKGIGGLVFGGAAPVKLRVSHFSIPASVCIAFVFGLSAPCSSSAMSLRHDVPMWFPAPKKKV